jgi:adenine-specific DNA-methyltransferase
MAIERLRLRPSLDDERLRSLKQFVPEAFADGVISWEILRELLGERLDDEGTRTEHFGLTWPGKREARRLAAQPSKRSLVPVPSEGINEESTANIFIEGDNLEVLKLLQKPYAGRIKLIYIDPPYNTGNDYIYKDNFQETADDYLKRTGQMSVEGGLLTTNKKEGGRFHSNWLNMMYPRLLLAKNLLRDDGFIVASIDDEEFANLTHLLDQVFGEENRISILVWDRNRKNDANYFSVGHEYMIVYAKDEQKLRELDLRLRAPKEGIDDVRAEFERLKAVHKSDWEKVARGLREFFSTLADDDPRKPLNRYTKVDERGPYRDDGNINWPGGGGPMYEVLHPVTGKPCRKPRSGWRFPTKERFDEEVERGRIVFGEDENKVPSIRTDLFENATQVMTSVHYSYAQTAANDFDQIFDGLRVFDNPKPVPDIINLIRYLTESDDLVLDFFAGSATTAHAVLELNKRDASNRRFLCVQLAEPITDKTATGRNALSLGLNTIADVGKERIRRVIKRITLNGHNKLRDNHKQDHGFKVFKLDKSNFQAWQEYRGDDVRQLEILFAGHETPFVDGWEEQEVLIELLLIEGFPLDSKISLDNTLTSNRMVKVESDSSAHRLLICLEPLINEETIEGVAGLPREDIFICLDNALTDTAKVRLTDVGNVRTI